MNIERHCKLNLNDVAPSKFRDNKAWHQSFHSQLYNYYIVTIPSLLKPNYN